jgi:hypothetical protein
MRLYTGRTAHRGSRGISLLFHDHGTRMGWGASVTPRPLFTPGKDPGSIVQMAGSAPGPVSTGAENLAPTGIRSPDRPARSQSLHQLSYPDHPSHKHTASISNAEDGGINLYQSTRCHNPDDTVQSHRRRSHKLQEKFLTFFFLEIIYSMFCCSLAG